MAMHRGRQGEWPRVKREPDAWVLKPDGFERTERSLAGPLRTGTSQLHGVGPKGLSAGGESRTSDFGMDRVSPREFDPMGTSSSRDDQRRYPSELVARRRRD
jgi:hypothetical protein